MPLGEPPAADLLDQIPSFTVSRQTLHRVYRPTGPDGEERSAWWFASVPEDPDHLGGRFDLPLPDGSCYLALSPVAAVLEVFQDYGKGLLPEDELRVRRRMEVVAPESAPPAADLTDPQAYGTAGVTAGLWAGGDEDVNLMSGMRAKTQRWAARLHEANWRSVHHGIQHDPSGTQRAVTLFDRAGQHAPYEDADDWEAQCEVHELLGDVELRSDLGSYGVQVARADVDLPIIDLDDSGGLQSEPP
jgi:hypothetical protein